MIIEKVFLGCLMKENYLIKDTTIRPNHLQEIRHQELMKRMLEFEQSGKNTDLLTLTTIPNLESYGGITYLADLESHCELDKFEEVERLILELWREREKRSILTLGAMNDWEIGDVIHRLEKISELKVDDYHSITECLAEIYNTPWEEEKQTLSATSGIKDLDKFTGGWQDGEVAILAARPSMGKTDVMLHFAKEAGWCGYLPIIFSLEMPQKLLTSRLVASTGNFNRMKLRNSVKLLKENQKEKWPGVIHEVNETNIQIFDGSGQTIPEMRAKIRKLVHQFPNKKPIIFIDYLTLIQANEVYGGNTHYQVSEISRNLKRIAKEFDCPMICLAQLNRSVESRAIKRPQMSDIRESGSIEQDADLILFLFREKYYDRALKDDSLEIIVAKNRNGPTGTVKVKYNEYTGRIEEGKHEG
ncbi:DNA helicase [Robertmurraya yapensis]|uniref:DNA 5'-3' helicase n=1 Tax=Bacillus yapensis TaxID=2492960 RepID=A0A3S0IJK3_9BACI|nr:DnaB-like helicase C-terminal domain-containing protein [Bacillus yapensis]RTR33941.1 DNA helicase [Bacillus yapensis]TKS97259.1 DNA helicase [Bacillus yapensis]